MKSIVNSRKRFNRQRNVENNNLPFFNKQSGQPVIQEKEGSSFFNTNQALGKPGIRVGKKGDKYEREADATADKIINKKGEATVIQRTDITAVQQKELEGANLQRQAEEEEMMQTQAQEEEENVQMQSQEEEEAVQAQAEDEEEDVQMQPEEEEEPVQARQEEEEPVQAKSNTNRHSLNANRNGLKQKLKTAKGGGKSIPKKTKGQMEQSFGVSFNNVQIHTDDGAVQMNQMLGAQAFTLGEHIFFNTGKYDPETTKGKHLLAHELTHVVQQNKQVLQKAQLMPLGDSTHQKEKHKQRIPEMMEKKIRSGLEEMLLQMDIPAKCRMVIKDGAILGLKNKSALAFYEAVEKAQVDKNKKELIKKSFRSLSNYIMK